jgi:hypothetical protein
MKRVMVCGWKVGLRKIDLTKLLRETMGYSLAEGKAVTDAIVYNQPVTLDVRDEQMEALISGLTRLGVKFTVNTEIPNSIRGNGRT